MRPQTNTLKSENGPDSDILVVEGVDDLYAMANLFRRTGLSGKIRIDEGGGYERLRESLSTRLDGSGLQRFGVLVDADEDLPARWDSIKAALLGCGYRQLPDLPKPEGIILYETGRPDVGIWIMPNNELPGALEDFAKLLIPDADSLWARASAVVDGIPTSDRLFRSAISKAKIHTWLAWQEEPGKPIGQAIIKKYFDTNSPTAVAFLNWIRLLYNLGEPVA